MFMRTFINIAFALWFKPLWRDVPTVSKVRRKYLLADRLASLGREPENVQYQDIGGFCVEWIGSKESAPRGIIIYLHGGGFAVRAKYTDRRFCREISNHSGLPVVLVPYRLAPEHPYPNGLDDCCRAYESLINSGVPPGRIIIIGHSAGANYALVLLMRARERGVAQPAGAILLSAPTDLTARSPSVALNSVRDVMLGPNIWPWVEQTYLGNTSPDHPEVSPIFGDWSRLAPLYFHVSDSEVILDDSRRAVKKARESGVPAQISIWHDVPHNFYYLSFLSECKRFREQMLDSIKTTLELQQTADDIDRSTAQMY